MSRRIRFYIFFFLYAKNAHNGAQDKGDDTASNQRIIELEVAVGQLWANIAP